MERKLDFEKTSIKRDNPETLRRLATTEGRVGILSDDVKDLQQQIFVLHDQMAHLCQLLVTRGSDISRLRLVKPGENQ